MSKTTDSQNGSSIIAVLVKDVDRHDRAIADNVNRITAVEISMAALRAKVALYAAFGAAVGSAIVSVVVSYLVK